MTVISVVVELALKILKALFGIDEPSKTTTEHPKPDIEITDGKTDEERLKDLGL